MLYEIKVLKAPWPTGAKVGDVLDMPCLPAWAQGKCSIAVDGSEVTIEFVEPVAADGVNRPVVGDGSGQALPSAESINAEFAELRAKLEASEALAAALQAKLDAAETDDGKAAAALKEADAQADAERAASESKAGKGKR